jgi:hypothetical protein
LLNASRSIAPASQRTAATLHPRRRETVSTAVEARSIIDTAQVLGKQLYLSKAPLYDGDKVQANFVWVEDIVSQADRVCSQLKGKIDAYNIKEDGGVATIVDLLTNGHDKQGNQLKDNRHVTATFLLSIYPPTNMAITDIKTLATGIYDLCNKELRGLQARRLAAAQLV